MQHTAPSHRELVGGESLGEGEGEGKGGADMQGGL